MKTEEDEAFDDLARNQGDWGGGFQAKRQMAADKLQEPVVQPAPGYCKNCKDYTIEKPLYAQPAQEPVECLDCGSNNVGFPATYDSLVNSVKAQPAQESDALTIAYQSGYYDGKQAALAQPPLPVQEPVACIVKGHLYMAHEFMSEIPEGATLLYTTPPKRKWVGMTLDEIEELFQSAAGADEETVIRFARLIESKIKEKNT